MRTIISTIRSGWRAALATVTLAAAVPLAGCDDFMNVTNPGAIENEALEDAGYVDLMTAGVIGDFQPAFAWTALFSGVFADELRNHHAFFENGEINRREVNNNNGTYIAAVYNGVHRTRFLADSVATRINNLLGAEAASDLRLARVQALGGYSWTLLGEQYCETPINRSANVPSDKLLETAIQRFEAAIPVAVAAKAAATPEKIPDAASRARYIAGADSVANLARVGAARAALNLSAYTPAARQKALEHARAVTPAYVSEASLGFRYDAIYALDGGTYTRRVSNPAYEFITSGRWFSVTGTRFEALNDPRVPMRPELVRMADGTQRNIVNSPGGFSTNDRTVEGAPITQESSIRLASALEARYIIAELEGLSPANLAFVDERRSVGGQAALPMSATEAQYQEALREQRARDLYLDSHRMGDLRRYKDVHNVDLWPRGAYFGSATEQFGTQECWPVPLAELF